MRLYTRKDMYWCDFAINGNRYRRPCGTADKKKAELIAAEIRQAQLHALANKAQRHHSWLEAEKRYLEEHTHLRSYDRLEFMLQFWRDAFQRKGVTMLADIDPDLVRDIMQEELNRPKERGKGRRSPTDVNNKLRILRCVINAVHRDWRWIKADPPRFKLLPGEVKRMRWIRPDQAIALSKACGDKGDIVLLALATGLRQANVMKMRLEYINLAERTITIPANRSKNKSDLQIPINNMALEIINRWKDNGTEWLFPINTREPGKPLRRISPAEWYGALKTVGLEDFRWHDLRHTWATMLRKSGVSLDKLQRLGGWKSASMVERYAHLDVSDLAADAGVMDEVFATKAKLRLAQ